MSYELTKFDKNGSTVRHMCGMKFDYFFISWFQYGILTCSVWLNLFSGQFIRLTREYFNLEVAFEN